MSCNCKVEVSIIIFRNLEPNSGPNMINKKGDRDKFIKSPKWDIGGQKKKLRSIYKNLQLDKHDDIHTKTISKEVWTNH